jgi:hypothetical protein
VQEDGHEPPSKLLRSLSTPPQTNQQEYLGHRSDSTGDDNMDTVEQPYGSEVMKESDSDETFGSFKSVDMADSDSDLDLGGGSKRGGLKIQIKRKNRTLKKKKN